MDQQRISNVFHWGEGFREVEDYAHTKHSISTILVDMGAKHIVSSKYHRLFLTVHGSVYWLKDRDDQLPEPQVGFARSFDSSAGRAVDCSGQLISIGRWFNPGSKDFYF